MSRLRALIPFAIVAVLIAVFFVVVPALRESFEAPPMLEPSENLPPPPTVQITGELEHDFGEIEIIDPIELTHTFTITNAETRPIKVFIEGTSCHCVAGEIAKDTLAPGESLDVHVTLSVTRPGKLLQKVYLNANGALVTLQTTATVTMLPQPAAEGAGDSR